MSKLKVSADDYDAKELDAKFARMPKGMADKMTGTGTGLKKAKKAVKKTTAKKKK